MVAAIRPQGKKEGVWALPKGNIDPGERPDETALREVLEETGVQGRLGEKLGDVKYTYTRRGGLRVFKVVSFYLLRAGRGRLGEIEEAMRVEVAEARWLPLEEAPKLLAYGGGRQMAKKGGDRLVGGACRSTAPNTSSSRRPSSSRGRGPISRAGRATSAP